MRYLKLFEQFEDDPFGEESPRKVEIIIDKIKKGELKISHIGTQHNYVIENDENIYTVYFHRNNYYLSDDNLNDDDIISEQDFMKIKELYDNRKIYINDIIDKIQKGELKIYPVGKNYYSIENEKENYSVVVGPEGYHLMGDCNGIEVEETITNENYEKLKELC